MSYIYRDLIKAPLNGDELKKLAKVGKITLKELVNLKSQAFKKLQPDLTAMNDEEVMQLINSEPRIMRRPVLSNGKQMVIGFTESEFENMLS